MDISVKSLEQAISIRRQIDNLQRRLSSILGGGAPPTMTTTRPAAGRYFSPSTRAKLSAAARARCERLRGGATTATSARKKGQLTHAEQRQHRYHACSPTGLQGLIEDATTEWNQRRLNKST